VSAAAALASPVRPRPYLAVAGRPYHRRVERPSNVDEHHLLAQLRNGDEAAFLSLVERHHAALVRLARAHVPSQAVAEEVAQETWVAVLDGLDRFEARSSLKTWIFRILVNRARTRGVRERRTVPFSSVTDPEPSVDPSRFQEEGQRYPGHWATPPTSWDEIPEERLVSTETFARIRAAIDELPPSQREVIVLRDIQGWPSEEVSEALGVSPGNQRVLLHRARSRVRDALERYFGDAEPAMASGEGS
jgi:RNA polymerase sigma-70 factor (ECF subfamily)